MMQLYTFQIIIIKVYPEDTYIFYTYKGPEQIIPLPPPFFFPFSIWKKALQQLRI